MTLENMLRGTSDFGAMCDQAYGIRVDEHLRNRGAGPMEIELVNLKDRERLGGLTSIRLAASYKGPRDICPTSLIDQTGNFRRVDFKETKARDAQTLNQLVENNPMMSVTELSEATGMKVYTVRETLKSFGWHVAKGVLTGIHHGIRMRASRVLTASPRGLRRVLTWTHRQSSSQAWGLCWW
jgi:hypothetical protein